MDIKFQFLYKGAPFHGGTKEFNWHKKVYSLDQLISTKLSNLCDVHNTSTLIAKRQFTGLKDKNGVEIYCGDIVKWGGGDDPVIEAVSYDPDEAMFCTETSMVCMHTMAVIGNIYENPELIENNN